MKEWRGNPWSDDRTRGIIGFVLRWGAALAAATVFAGGVMYLRSCGGAIPDYRVFLGEPPELRAVTGIVREAFSLNPLGVIQLGLLLLIATPLAGVAFSLAAFALQRDLAYVAATLIILSVVLFGLARHAPDPAAPMEKLRPVCRPLDISWRFPPMMEVPEADTR